MSGPGPGVRLVSFVLHVDLAAGEHALYCLQEAREGQDMHPSPSHLILLNLARSNDSRLLRMIAARLAVQYRVPLRARFFARPGPRPRGFTWLGARGARQGI
jgi:hypothetical protein